MKDDADYKFLVDDAKMKMQEAFDHADECKQVFAPMKVRDLLLAACCLLLAAYQQPPGLRNLLIDSLLRAPMKDMALENNDLDIAQVAEDARRDDDDEDKKTLVHFKQDLDTYNTQLQQFEKLPEMTYLGLVRSCYLLRAAF